MPSTTAPTTLEQCRLELDLSCAEVNISRFHELWLKGWICGELLTLRDLYEMVNDYALDDIIVQHYGISKGVIRDKLFDIARNFVDGLQSIINMDDLSPVRRLLALRMLAAFERENVACDAPIVELRGHARHWLDEFSRARFELCITVIKRKRGDHDRAYSWALHEAAAMFTSPAFEPERWFEVKELTHFTDCHEGAIERAVDSHYEMRGLYETLTDMHDRGRMIEPLADLLKTCR